MGVVIVSGCGYKLIMATDDEFLFSSSDFRSICCCSQTGDLDKLKSIINSVSKADRSQFSPNTFCPCPSKHQPSPIVLAAQNERLDVLQYFMKTFPGLIDINKGATVISKTQRIKTHNVSPLVAACTVDNLEVVKYLMKMGADIHKPTLTRATALRAASYYGHMDIMQYLIDNGANINTPNCVGSSPLLAAATNGGAKATLFLLKKGCDQSQRTVEGRTAIHEAAERGNVEVVKILLDNGMSPYFAPSYPRPSQPYIPCPLYLAASMVNMNVLNLLIDHPACLIECKAEAYLLLGASIYDVYGNNNMYNTSDLPSCYESWLKGITIMESLVQPLPITPQIEEYFNHKLITTSAQLQSLFNAQDIRIPLQSLIIRERCLGTADQSLIECLIKRGISLACSSCYKECEALWKRAMFVEETICNIECSHPTYGYCDGILRALNGDMNDYLEGIELIVLSKDSYVPNFGCVFQFGLDCLHHLRTLESCNKADSEVITLQPIILCLLKLLCLWSRDYETPSDEYITACRKLVDSYLHYTPVNNLLFDYLTGIDTKNTNNITLDTLLACGADQCINLTLPNGMRPIQFVFLNIDSADIKSSDDNNFFSILIKHGAHIDIVNNKGETLYDWKLLNSPAHSYIMMSYGPLPLSCIAAHSIVNNNIDYCNLPSHVISFIELHDPKCV